MLNWVVSAAWSTTSGKMARPVTAVGTASGRDGGIGWAAIVTEFLMSRNPVGSSTLRMSSWTLGSTWSRWTVWRSWVTSSKSGRKVWACGVLLMTWYHR